jgi:sRNA-binding protein
MQTMSKMLEQQRFEIYQKLFEFYPNTFFEDARKRRPLKKNIARDIANEHPEYSESEIASAIEYYCSHIGYDIVCQSAGVGRVDLSGHEVSKITSSEAEQHRKRIPDKQAIIDANKREKHSMAPRSTSIRPQPVATNPEPDPDHQSLAAATEAIASATNVLRDKPGRMRSTLLVTALRVAVDELQSLISKHE